MYTAVEGCAPSRWGPVSGPNTSDTADGDTGGTPDGQRDGGSGSSGGQETDTRSGERSGA